MGAKTRADGHANQTHCSMPHMGQGVEPELEAEVDSKGLIEFGDKRRRQPADPPAYSFDGYGPDLFRLRF